MSDLSSEDFDLSPPRPVIMISKPPSLGIGSSDEEEVIDCEKDTSNEELVRVDPKVKKFVPPLLARPVNSEETKTQPKLQRPIRHPDGSPVGHTLPSKSAPKPTQFPHSALVVPTPKSNKSQSSTNSKPTRPAPLPKASVISFNMEDNLTVTSVKDLPMKPTQHQLSSPDQDSVVGKLKEEIVFLVAARKRDAEVIEHLRNQNQFLNRKVEEQGSLLELKDADIRSLNQRMNEPTFVDVDSLRGLLAGEAVVPAAGPDSQAGQLSGRTASWGRVVSRAGGQGLAGVTVVLEGATVTTAVTDSQGQYYMEDLRSGFYTVNATKGDLHDYQFPTLQVEISPTAPGLPTLVPTHFRVSGQLQFASPTNNAVRLVLVQKLGTTEAGQVTLHTGGDGKFQAMLRPGQYSVTVQPAASDREARQKFAPQNHAILVTETPISNLCFSLISIPLSIARVPCDFNNKCQKTFESQKKKEIHIEKMHHGPKKFTCPDCGYQTNRPYDLNVHRRVHNKPDINCIDCGKKMQNNYKLRQHMTTHHTIGEYNCPVCQKKYPIKYDLILHKKSCMKASSKLKFGYPRVNNASHPATTTSTSNVVSNREQQKQPENQPRISDYERLRENNIAERRAKFREFEKAPILTQLFSQNEDSSSSQELEKSFNPDQGDSSSLEPTNPSSPVPTRGNSPSPVNSSSDPSLA